MSAERIDLLCEELQSGKWEQIHGSLTDGSERGRCALGVACEVYMRETHDWVELSGTAFPPEKVLRWFGLSYTIDEDGLECFVGSARVPFFDSMEDFLDSEYVPAHGYEFKEGDQFTLSQLNDNGYDFHRIAGIILDNPEGQIWERHGPFCEATCECGAKP